MSFSCLEMTDKQLQSASSLPIELVSQAIHLKLKDCSSRSSKCRSVLCKCNCRHWLHKTVLLSTEIAYFLPIFHNHTHSTVYSVAIHVLWQALPLFTFFYYLYYLAFSSSLSSILSPSASPTACRSSRLLSFLSSSYSLPFFSCVYSVVPRRPNHWQDLCLPLFRLDLPE